jgi:hypothetical protein
MESLRFAQGNSYSICHDLELDAVLLHWFASENPELFTHAYQSVLELIYQKNVSVLLIDFCNCSPILPEQQYWLKNRWVPQAVQAGLCVCVGVSPKSVLSALTVEQTIRATNGQGLDVFLLPSLPEARQWIQNYKRSVHS